MKYYVIAKFEVIGDDENEIIDELVSIKKMVTDVYDNNFDIKSIENNDNTIEVSKVNNNE